MKIIITGATGMIGEGVLLASLDHRNITEVLMVNRRASLIKHPKLSELIVKDFTGLAAYSAQLTGYDGCFYCAGKVPLVWMSRNTATSLFIPQ